VASLLRQSTDFASLWNRQEVGLHWSDAQRFVHPQVGRIYLFCQNLQDPDQSQALLIFTATPGTYSYDKPALLNVLGADRFPGARARPGRSRVELPLGFGERSPQHDGHRQLMAREKAAAGPQPRFRGKYGTSRHRAPGLRLRRPAVRDVGTVSAPIP